jgi:hypothetical protein
VSVRAWPGLGAGREAGGGGAPVDADVTDRGDGSYVARFTVPAKGNYTIRVEVEDIEVDGSPFPVFFGAPGSLNAAEAARAADEAVAAAAAAAAAATGSAPGGLASAPGVAPGVAPGAPGSMAAAAQAAAAAAEAAPLAMPAAPKVIGGVLSSGPLLTPAAIAAAAAAAAASGLPAAAAAYALPGGGMLGGGGTPNPMAAAMASAAAAAAAGATFVNPLAANPLHQQLASQLLAAKGVLDAGKRCVVVSRFPPGVEAASLKALLGVAGVVRDVALAGPEGDRMALAEFSDAEEAAKALSLNGMKLGDTHTLQVWAVVWGAEAGCAGSACLGLLSGPCTMPLCVVLFGASALRMAAPVPGGALTRSLRARATTPPQVLAAPVLSMPELAALNPMMALQMQSVQQATVRASRVRVCDVAGVR